MKQIGRTPHTWLEATPGPFSRTRPSIRSPNCSNNFQWHGDTPGRRTQQAQLEPRLELAGLKPAETIPLVAPLLESAAIGQYPPSALAPDQQRRHLLATLVEWVLGSARVQPLVIATEDLHWADPRRWR